MTENDDAIVIGAGQADPSLVSRLDHEGRNTAVIVRHRTRKSHQPAAGG